VEYAAGRIDDFAPGLFRLGLGFPDHASFLWNGAWRRSANHWPRLHTKCLPGRLIHNVTN